MRRPGAGAVIIIGIFVLGAAACDDELTGPSEGITVYEDRGYEGDGRRFDGNEFDLDEVNGPCNTSGGSGDWDDCISSIRIPAGWEVTVYEDPDYEGESRTFTDNVPDLEFEPGPCGDDWDECISSLRINRF